MARKSGCPFNIRDYSVKIENKVTDDEVQVKGLNSMSVDVDADTDDGKTGDAVWAEQFIKGRSVSGSLSGRPIVDRVTGTRDPGQSLMHKAAYNSGGCDNDQTLIVADAIGKAVKYDCVITKESISADEDGEEISWDWEGVGQPEELPYVQLTGVAFKDGGSTATTATVTVGSTKEITVAFTPEDASNQRFSYSIGDESIAALNAIDGPNISIRGVSAGNTKLTIKTMNNSKTADLTITVNSAAG